MEEAIKKKKIAMPDTLIIVAAIVLLTAILTWIIPSGTYDYKEVNINGTVRNVAIDGTYHVIDKADVVTTGFLGFLEHCIGDVLMQQTSFLLFCVAAERSAFW